MRSTNGNVQTYNGNVQTHNGNVQTHNGNVQPQKLPNTFAVYEDHEDESNKTYETRSRSKTRKESPTKKFKDNLSSVSRFCECIEF